MKKNYGDVPKEISDTKGYIGTVKIGNEYCVVFKYGDDDFSYWITEDIMDETAGSSCRGNVQQVAEELAETEFSEVVELIK